jgi:hypothetical protein
MTGVQWIKTLEHQSRDLNKPVFSITELTALSGLKRSSLSVQLSRLTKAGVFVRLGHGLYGVEEQPPELIIGYLDPSAYCTGHYALFKYGMITQSPTVITCFTNKHHGRSRIMSVGARTFEFVKPAPDIYRHPASRALAPPQQAFCDFVFVCRNRGVSPASIVTLRKLSNLNMQEIRRLLANYPATVRSETLRLLGGKIV